MAYILRSLAVIGVIALNSPANNDRSDAHHARAMTTSVARSVNSLQPHEAASSLTAAREAAQIIAGLDPETRQRLLEIAAAATRSAMTGPSATR